MFQIINPTEYPSWDELILTNEKHVFFHTSAWTKVISESYNYKPLCFTEIKDNKLRALVPVMVVKSFLTGKRGVSLPFTDYCPVIAFDEKNFRDLFEKIVEYGKKTKWEKIEFRGGKEYFHDKIPCQTYITHILDLTRPKNKILSTFRDSTKRNIKKAIKKNLRVQILSSLESVKEFYRLNCLTRKDHGLPPQPFYFFKKIYEHIISTKKGFVLLVLYRNKVIAGAVYSHFEKKALFKYGASDKTYHHLRPNNLSMWEAIKWYKQNGYESLSLGRTEPHNKGLLQFKRGWGTQEEFLYYYKYDLSKNEFVKDNLRFDSFRNYFRKLPLPLLKLTGSFFYRHIG